MAGKNRDSYKSQVNTDYPSGSAITAAQHRTHVSDELADNIKYRLDVIDNFGNNGGSQLIDFEDYDRVDAAVTLTGPPIFVDFSFTNLEDGDDKYLRVTKHSDTLCRFTSVTETIEDSKEWDGYTELLFQVTKKGTTTFVTAKHKVINVDWTQPTLNANFSHVSGNELKYRKTFNNQLQIKGGFDYTGPFTGATPFTLPTGFRPTENRHAVYVYESGGGDLAIHGFIVKTTGEIVPEWIAGAGHFWEQNQNIHLDVTIPID